MILKKHSDGYTWLHSGDIGYISEDGCIFLDGRLKRIIIRYDGLKVSPFNIEKAILKSEYVSNCCVVSNYDKKHQRGQVPIAFVELKAEHSSIKPVDQLWNLCKSEISDHYLPAEIVFIEKLPLTANGKIDYRTLEKIATEEVP